MTGFSPTQRTIRAEYKDSKLVSVVLKEQGEIVNKYVPTERSEWEIGDVLFHHPPGEDITDGTSGGGFLWEVRAIPHDEVLLTNRRSDRRNEKDLDVLESEIADEIVVIVAPK